MYYFLFCDKETALNLRRYIFVVASKPKMETKQAASK